MGRNNGKEDKHYRTGFRRHILKFLLQEGGLFFFFFLNELLRQTFVKNKEGTIDSTLEQEDGLYDLLTCLSDIFYPDFLL